MSGFLRLVKSLQQGMMVLAGINITMMVLITVTNITLRIFKRPMSGTYELIVFFMIFMVSCSLPYTSWMRAHVRMDLLISVLPVRAQTALNIGTRCAGIALFLTIGVMSIVVGIDLRSSKEVSAILQIPVYIYAFILGCCSFVQCLVLFVDVFRGEVAEAGDHAQ